ncbi:hypothetical protein HMPREF9565_02084 [Cutibacterium acnes HL053PA2]|nr:hypothetical protein HMPREF9565_02084 [Cutibacterium acnes HL053PA2]
MACCPLLACWRGRRRTCADRPLCGLDFDVPISGEQLIHALLLLVSG